MIHLELAWLTTPTIMRLYDTRRDSDSLDDEESMHPFRMTKAELQSLDPNFKEKKKKVFPYLMYIIVIDCTNKMYIIDEK